MPKTYYITSAIDYVNAKPHVGHALERVQVDVLARYHRMLGDDTFLLLGTDEFSMKNVQSAQKVGKDVQTFVDEYAYFFQDLGRTLNVSFDRFIRTTEKRHVEGAKKIWSAFKSEDVYKREYGGNYCIGCEDFKLEKDLMEGKCPEHPNTELERVEEENYFFKLSAYEDTLIEYIKSERLRIIPEHRRNEMLSFIRGGLQDFSISRSRKRAKDWGVPVPGDETQVMYVWVDALSNYITALDYAIDGDDYKRYWEGEGDRMHVIGKGILRFHAIYWPAMLLSAGLPLPTKIYVHEYLSVNGQKMSKSLGNVIEPNKLVEKYGVDGTRYVLLSSLPYTSDGDISWEKMTEKYNADLANGLGNLVSRVVTLKFKGLKFKGLKEEFPEEFKKLLDEARIYDALEYIWEGVRAANKYIDEMKPWELKKTDEEKFGEVMEKLFKDLHHIAFLLTPFLPETSEKMLHMLRTGEKDILFKRLNI